MSIAAQKDVENPWPEGITEERAEEPVGVDAQGRRWRRQGCDPNMFMIQLLLTATTIFTAYISGESRHSTSVLLPVALGTVNFILSQVRACR